MEQNREPRNKPKSLWSINIRQRRQQHKMGQKQPYQQMVLGDLDSYGQKNETRSPSYTIHKNKLKMDKGLKYKSYHHKSPRGKHWQENLRHSTQQRPQTHPLKQGT